VKIYILESGWNGGPIIWVGVGGSIRVRGGTEIGKIWVYNWVKIAEHIPSLSAVCQFSYLKK